MHRLLFLFVPVRVMCRRTRSSHALLRLYVLQVRRAGKTHSLYALSHQGLWPVVLNMTRSGAAHQAALTEQFYERIAGLTAKDIPDAELRTLRAKQVCSAFLSTAAYAPYAYRTAVDRLQSRGTLSQFLFSVLKRPTSFARLQRSVLDNMRSVFDCLCAILERSSRCAAQAFLDALPFTTPLVGTVVAVDEVGQLTQGTAHFLPRITSDARPEPARPVLDPFVEAFLQTKDVHRGTGLSPPVRVVSRYLCPQHGCH